MEQTVYPLAAMVGQKTFRQGLLLAAVNPAIGGILVRGEKGTAKSTMVRALAALLPDIPVVRNCAFSCSPEPGEDRCPDCQRSFPQLETTIRRARLINLPLNATEDRVAGGIDFPRSLQRGKVVFSPGLLASAHRGLLYVDEVNLLDDHIVDGDNDAVYFTFAEQAPYDLRRLPRTTRLEWAVASRLERGGHWPLRRGRIAQPLGCPA